MLGISSEEEKLLVRRGKLNQDRQLSLPAVAHRRRRNVRAIYTRGG
jgi:hypothetical protein